MLVVFMENSNLVSFFLVFLLHIFFVTLFSSSLFVLFFFSCTYSFFLISILEKAGLRMKLPTPETWETLLSEKGNKSSTWEELIEHKKLPFMAMLRNLRLAFFLIFFLFECRRLLFSYVHLYVY